MKPLRALAFAALLLPVSMAAAEEAPDPGAKFRAALASSVQSAGKSAAVAGTDGWLFLAGELHFLSLDPFWGPAAAKVSRAPKPELANPLPAIVDFQKQLQARGVSLLLVPVPPKAAIYPEKLLPPGAGATTEPLEHFYQELATQGVEVLDLAPGFRAARATTELYCRTDTHWSPAGCALAAELIAQQVREKLGTPKGAGGFAGRAVTVDIEGDLVAMLPAGTAKPEREKLSLTQVSKVAGGAAVVADPNSPVLVLGDSHTLVFHEFAAERAGLLDQLALQLGAAPDLIGVRGSGSTAVRVSLYRRTIKDPAYLAKKKIVVWCFAAREFTESDAGWAKLPVAK